MHRRALSGEILPSDSIFHLSCCALWQWQTQCPHVLDRIVVAHRLRGEYVVSTWWTAQHGFLPAYLFPALWCWHPEGNRATPRSSSHDKAFEDPGGGKRASVCLLWLIPSGNFTQLLLCENSNVRQNIRESPCPNLDPLFIPEYSTESHLGLCSLSEILTDFTLSTAQDFGWEERNLTMYECYNLCLWWNTASSSGELQKVVLWKGIINLSWRKI